MHFILGEEKQYEKSPEGLSKIRNRLIQHCNHLSEEVSKINLMKSWSLWCTLDVDFVDTLSENVIRHFRMAIFLFTQICFTCLQMVLTLSAELRTCQLHPLHPPPYKKWGVSWVWY